MTFIYIFATILISIFNPSMGTDIAMFLNNTFHSDFSGLFFWICGLLIAFILD